MRTRDNQSQLPLIGGEPRLRRPPSTRYQGSKFKLLDWIWENLRQLDFESALDAFGGTGSVSYLLKAAGKAVTFNDYLKFNHLIGTAIIENVQVTLSEDEVNSLLVADPAWPYDHLIAETFKDIYFTDDENVWLDVVCQNIHRLSNKYQMAIALYALFQSCVAKRPYNLFHRKNLYMRFASVERNFGNKATWDTPFEKHFRSFVKKANVSVFDSGVPCKAVHYEATEVPGRFDLVYLDPPYVNKKGSTVDYRDFYHFLEGLVIYPHWRKEIDYSRKHLPLKGTRSPWSNPKEVMQAFRDCIDRYADSTIVVSYGNKGIPSPDDLVSMLKYFKSKVSVIEQSKYKYVLSIDSTTKELLFVAR